MSQIINHGGMPEDMQEDIERMEGEGGPPGDVEEITPPNGESNPGQGDSTDVPGNNPEQNDEQPSSDDSFQGPPVMVGPHELGGIKVIARDIQGNHVISRLNLDDAAMLMAHLNALMTMMFQAMYNQAAAREQEVAKTARDIYVPRS